MAKTWKKTTKDTRAKKDETIERVRVAVIGLGIGKAHLEGYGRHPMAEVAALCDTDEARLKEQAEARKVDAAACFTSTDDLFAAAERLELNAVSVCLPNHLHAPVTLAALKTGLHVLVEKPLAMDAREGARMVEEAETRGLTLGINLSFRFRPESRALKDLVDAGALGRIYYAHTRWMRERGIPKFGGWFGRKDESGGGPIIDLGVHRMDLAMWLMGNPRPVSVTAATYDPVGSRLAREQEKSFDVEDFGVAFVRFEGGATLVLEASWAGFSGKREDQLTELLGERGGIRQVNASEGYQYEAWLYREESGSLTETRIRRRLGPSPGFAEDFVDALTAGREPLAPGAHGLQVQRVLDAIYESARTGSEVKIEAT